MPKLHGFPTLISDFGVYWKTCIHETPLGSAWAENLRTIRTIIIWAFSVAEKLAGLESLSVLTSHAINDYQWICYDR